MDCPWVINSQKGRKLDWLKCIPQKCAAKREILLKSLEWLKQESICLGVLRSVRKPNEGINRLNYSSVNSNEERNERTNEDTYSPSFQRVKEKPKEALE